MKYESNIISGDLLSKSEIGESEYCANETSIWILKLSFSTETGTCKIWHILLAN